MTWEESAYGSIIELCKAKATNRFSRQQLIDNYLDRICEETGTIGRTPDQTLSRVLQQLRDRGLVAFLEPGQYELL